MTEPTETILEKRGYFWWDDGKMPKGRYAPPHGVPGMLTIREDGKTRLNVTASLLHSKALGSKYSEYEVNVPRFSPPNLSISANTQEAKAPSANWRKRSNF